MIVPYPYTQILYSEQELPDIIKLVDHLHGFDSHYQNQVLSSLDQHAARYNKIINVRYHQILEGDVKLLYKNLDITYELYDHVYDLVWAPLRTYTAAPGVNYKNFVCSFNGVPHISRKLLVSAIHKFGWYDSNYVSKNFAYTTDNIDGHLQDYLTDQQQKLYLPFFTGKRSKNFFKTINSFGHLQYDHARNIYNLDSKITESFLHIVSESMATSYCPYVSEKFLYSVVTRGLFLAYAQPGWHQHLEKYYGFRLYTQLFDYSFDTILNPVERLLSLMTMISKFSFLTHSERVDLYHLEADAIEYNYHHYHSGNYLKCLGTSMAEPLTIQS